MNHSSSPFRFLGAVRKARAGLVALFVTLGTLLLAGPAAADPPGRVGRVAEMQGTVWFYSPDNGDWIAATRNRPVTTGDRIATDTGARAEVRIGSSSVRLDASSELEVLRLDDEAVRLQLHSGSAALRIRSPGAAREFDVATGEGHFLPLGAGSYRIDRADETSTATAWRGSLRYEGNGQGLTIEDGQRGDFWIDGATARYNLVAPDRDAFSDYVSSRDREDDAVAVAPYVSPEMTGAEDLNRYGNWQQSPDYGALWVPTTVVAGWAPYRYGHWGSVQPWGWTWIDDAPWGFAPFHYGRWVQFGGRWGWSPGTYVARPVYAPALVAWLGGPRLSVSVSIGSTPSVGWFPLGPREVYVPSYRVSPGYVRNVNVTQVTNITNITNIINSPHTVLNQTTYINRSVGGAVTVVPSSVLANRQPVAPVAVKVVDQHAVGELVRQQPVLRSAPVTPAPIAQFTGARGAPPLRVGEPSRVRGPRERPVAQANEPAAALAAEPQAPRAAAPPPLPKVRMPATAAPDVRAPDAGERRDAPRGETRGVPPMAAAVPPPPGALPRVNRGETVPAPRAEPAAPAHPRGGPREGQARGGDAGQVPPPPHGREAAPRVREAPPQVREAAPQAREARPAVREAPPHMREAAPQVRESAPQRMPVPQRPHPMPVAPPQAVAPPMQPMQPPQVQPQPAAQQQSRGAERRVAPRERDDGPRERGGDAPGRVGFNRQPN